VVASVEEVGVSVPGVSGNDSWMSMPLRSHPRSLDLAAWFDGEIVGDVGAHVARCARCQRETAELARIRAWLRPTERFASLPADPAVKGG
jgi:hypothetical protein